MFLPFKTINLPDYNTLVLKTPFHGDKSMLSGGKNVWRFVDGVSKLVVKVDMMFSIDWVCLIRIDCNQDHAYMCLRMKNKLN